MKRLFLILYICLLPLIICADGWYYAGGIPPVPPETATFYASNDQGYVRKTNASSFTTARNSTSGSVAIGEGGVETISYIAGYNYLNNNYVCRSFFYFDTSALPDSATIISVTFHIYALAAMFNETFGIAILEGTQADTLTGHDFTHFGDLWGYNAGPSTGDGYITVNFNAAGCLGINKTGVTKICARNYEYDYLNVVPPPDSLIGCGRFYNNRYAGTDHDPYLEVTYR